MSFKKQIINTMNHLYNKNYITIRDGNISYKPKNKSYFFLTCGGVKKNNLNSNQIIKINFDKNKNIFYDTNYKYLPSREINIHSFIQMDDYYKEKNMFVVHAVQPTIIPAESQFPARGQTDWCRWRHQQHTSPCWQ